MKIKTLLTALFLIIFTYGYSQIEATIGGSELEINKKNGKEEAGHIIGMANDKIYYLSTRTKTKPGGLEPHPKITVFDLDMKLLQHEEVNMPKGFLHRKVELLDGEIYFFLSRKQKGKQDVVYQKMDKESLQLTGEPVTIGSFDFKGSSKIYGVSVEVVKPDNKGQFVIIFHEKGFPEKGLYACIDAGKVIKSGNYDIPVNKMKSGEISDLNITEFPNFVAIYRFSEEKIPYTNLSFYLGKLEENFKIEKIEPEPGVDFDNFSILNWKDSKLKLVGISKKKVSKKFEKIQNVITYDYTNSKLSKIDEMEILSLFPESYKEGKKYLGLIGNLHNFSDGLNVYIGLPSVLYDVNNPRTDAFGDYNVNPQTVLSIGFGFIMLGINSSGKISWNYFEDENYSFNMLESNGKNYMASTYYEEENEANKGRFLELNKDGIKSSQMVVCNGCPKKFLEFGRRVVQTDQYIYLSCIDYRAERKSKEIIHLVKLPMNFDSSSQSN